MKIAMVSEHASPLAALGGVDAGGQNVHVAALADALARRGHQITVYTRREDPTVAERVSGSPGVEVVHVPAGPPSVLPKDELLPFMTAFGDWMAADWDRQGRPTSSTPTSGCPVWRRREPAAPVPSRWPRPSTPSVRSNGATRAPRTPAPRTGSTSSDTCVARSTWCSPPVATRSVSSPPSGSARTGYGSSPAAWTPTSSPPPPTPANRGRSPTGCSRSGGWSRARGTTASSPPCPSCPAPSSSSPVVHPRTSSPTTNTPSSWSPSPRRWGSATGCAWSAPSRGTRCPASSGRRRS